MQELFSNWGYDAPVPTKATSSHLRELRQAAGLTVRELAGKIGVQHTNIVFWENNNKLPRSEVLLDMAEALGVSVEEVLGSKPARPKQLAASKVGRVFEAVSKLPRRQQAKVVEFVEAFVSQQNAS